MLPEIQRIAASIIARPWRCLNSVGAAAILAANVRSELTPETFDRPGRLAGEPTNRFEPVGKTEGQPRVRVGKEVFQLGRRYRRCSTAEQAAWPEGTRV